MSNSPSSISKQALDIHTRFAVELAFVTPGEKTGLLPINSFFMDLEDLLEKNAPEQICKSIALCQAWISEIFDGAGTFSEKSIQRLNEWHAWFGEAIAAWEINKTLPSQPSSWEPDSSTPSGNKISAATPAPDKKVTEAVAAEEKAITLNLSEDAELLNEFHAESVDSLQSIEQGLLILEENPSNSGTINSIFRAFHTFKGAAGFLRLIAIQDLAHDLESLLDAARQSKIKINSTIIDLILAGSDALKKYTFEINE